MANRWIITLFIIAINLSIVKWLLTIITTPYFDRVLKYHKIPLPSNDHTAIPYRVLRGMIYSLCSVSQYPWPWSYYRAITKDFNFRQHARTIDIVLGCWLLLILLATVACIAFPIGLFTTQLCWRWLL